MLASYSQENKEESLRNLGQTNIVVVRLLNVDKKIFDAGYVKYCLHDLAPTSDGDRVKLKMK